MCELTYQSRETKALEKRATFQKISNNLTEISSILDLPLLQTHWLALQNAPVFINNWYIFMSFNFYSFLSLLESLTVKLNSIKISQTS
jgi:hypothetical protein